MAAILSFAAMNRTPTVLLELSEEAELALRAGKFAAQLQQLSDFGVAPLHACLGAKRQNSLPLAAAGIRWTSQPELEELHRQAHSILSY